MPKITAKKPSSKCVLRFLCTTETMNVLTGKEIGKNEQSFHNAKIRVFVKSRLKIFILKEKRPKNLVQMPASEGLPQFSYLPCPFFHHLSKHLMKQKMVLKWWARWTFLPQQFWSIIPIPSPHSKATAVLKAGFARITYAWRKGLRFSGEERKEQEPTLLLFTKEKATKPPLWKRQVKKWLHKV